MELEVAHPVVRRAGEGESVGTRDEHAVVIKAEHELVDVIELRYAAGEPGPRPHVHREHADAFYDPARFDSFGPPGDGGRPVSDAVVRGPGEGDA